MALLMTNRFLLWDTHTLISHFQIELSDYSFTRAVPNLFMKSINLISFVPIFGIDYGDLPISEQLDTIAKQF